MNWKDNSFKQFFFLTSTSYTYYFLKIENSEQNPINAFAQGSFYKVLMQRLSPAKHKTAAAKSLQLCLTLCNPTDGSPPGSPVPGILQARTLEWVAISFSNTWNWKVKVKSLSHVWLVATRWTAAYQAPPPMGFSRQEYWSGVPLPSPKHKTKLSLNFCSSYILLSDRCPNMSG